MGGQDGSRGYLVQSLIALLDSLGDIRWESILIEPDDDSQKIDIFWQGQDGKKAVQVKSSINQIGKADAERWAAELRSAATADQYELVLVGPCAQSVVEMREFKGVAIPCPKNLDIDGLLSQAAHVMDKFLEGEKLDRRSATQRELMVAALTTRLSALSTKGQYFLRAELIAILKEWLAAFAGPIGIPWEQVSFDRQRGIESAVAGKRLGPSDVDACPVFTICNDIVAEVERSHFYEVVGTPGCGKSITGWHVARMFQRTGFSVWRPQAIAHPAELIASIPRSPRIFVFVDDAHQFGRPFAQRLSELSGPDLKVLLASTVQDAMQSSIICISPERCVEQLTKALIPRRKELLPIIQSHDDRVSDRYGDMSLDDRIQQASKENKPWEFFWVLRGGWQTARREFESAKQFANAPEMLFLIAVGQIASCDAGVDDAWLLRQGERAGVGRGGVEAAVKHLHELGLILRHDTVRTKHVSYAYRIVEESFRDSHRPSWEKFAALFLDAVPADGWSLRGVAWALDAVRYMDGFRWKTHTLFRPLVEPLTQRCIQERDDIDWAAGCLLRLFNSFEIATDDILRHRRCVMDWATSRSGLVSYFCGDIVNELINRSNQAADSTIARQFIDEFDGKRLAGVANTVNVDDLHTFGRLLDRLAFYKPSWADAFIERFDWPRAKQIILAADADRAFAVDSFVSGISLLARSNDHSGNLRYIEDAIPFIARAINTCPCDAMEEMHGILETCLGYGPKFLRGGWSPDEDQVRVANLIVDQVDPAPFARAMETAIARDLEKLARSFGVIRDIRPSVIERIAGCLSDAAFLASTRNDWKEQSDELQHIVSFFCLGESVEPAATWVRENRGQIAGSLRTLFVCIAPDVAIEFHRAGRAIDLVHSHWARTSFAIRRLAEADKSVCVEVVSQQLLRLQEAMYQLSLDRALYIIRFFRVLFDLSPDLFERFVNSLSLDHPVARDTIDRLLQNQHGERSEYRKLAQCGRRLTGRIAELAVELGDRLSQAPSQPCKEAS